MNRFGSALPLATVFGLALASAALPNHASAATAICALSLRSGSQPCYSASQARQAERHVPFALVNPVPTVGALTQLALSQVSVVRSANGSLSGYNYVFGMVPPHQDLIALPGTSSATAKYVLVQEIVGNYGFLPTSEHRDRPGGPWLFTFAVPARRLLFLITSNEPRGLVQQLGRRLAATGPDLRKSASHQPWNIKGVLTIGGVASLCSHHLSSRFTASVRGHLVSMALNGPGGGWVGRLFTGPNPRAFHTGDTTPFVQVWGSPARSLNLSNRQVTFHGLLSCDASKYHDASLPGWKGSMIPDRFSTT